MPMYRACSLVLNSIHGVQNNGKFLFSIILLFQGYVIKNQ
jgi:hypothetical protein